MSLSQRFKKIQNWILAKTSPLEDVLKYRGFLGTKIFDKMARKNTTLPLIVSQLQEKNFQHIHKLFLPHLLELLEFPAKGAIHYFLVSLLHPSRTLKQFCCSIIHIELKWLQGREKNDSPNPKRLIWAFPQGQQAVLGLPIEFD